MIREPSWYKVDLIPKSSPGNAPVWSTHIQNYYALVTRRTAAHSGQDPPGVILIFFLLSRAKVKNMKRRRKASPPRETNSLLPPADPNAAKKNFSPTRSEKTKKTPLPKHSFP